MCTFDFLLSLIYYFIGKIPFLAEIVDGIGEILDLGLTALVAAVMATAIWNFGNSIISKITGKVVDYESSYVFCVNFVFIGIFLFATVVLGIQFASHIGETIAFYTEDSQGLTKVLLFFEAIKNTFSYIRAENVFLYMIGHNSLILCIISAFATY